MPGDPPTERLVLRSSRRRSATLAAATAVLVAAGAAMGAAGSFILGWIFAGVFALGLAVFLAEVASPRRLELDADGFTMVQPFGTRRDTTAWRDVRVFTVGKLPGPGAGRTVHIAYEPDRAPAGSKVAEALARTEAMLPDTYGIEVEELVSLLERWRRDHS